MRKIIAFAAVLCLCVSCLISSVDTCHNEQSRNQLTLKSLITKSSDNASMPDSLQMKKLIQSDEDNLMMSRIIFKDSAYILAISRSSANNVGVSDEMYDKYVEYVLTLNGQ